MRGVDRASLPSVVRPEIRSHRVAIACYDTQFTRHRLPNGFRRNKENSDSRNTTLVGRPTRPDVTDTKNPTNRSGRGSDRPAGKPIGTSMRAGRALHPPAIVFSPADKDLRHPRLAQVGDVTPGHASSTPWSCPPTTVHRRHIPSTTLRQRRVLRLCDGGSA